MDILVEEKSYSKYLFDKYGVAKDKLLKFFNETYVDEVEIPALTKEEAERFYRNIVKT